MINIGAYTIGSNSEIDYAIRIIGKVNSFLSQDINQRISFEESKDQLAKLLDNSCIHDN